MTDEMISYHAAVAALPAFLRGAWDGIASDTINELCDVAAMDYALNHQTRERAVRHIALDPVWTTAQLTDAIMLFAYPLEPIDLSVTRLATAARHLGFTTLSPYAAAICYSRFPSLSKEYKTSWKTTTQTTK